MNKKGLSYALFGFGGAFLILGLFLATASTPSPARPVWFYYAPPTLPGILIWTGVVALGVAGFLRYRSRQREPTWV